MQARERYTVTVEEFDTDGTLARRLVESSEKDSDDYCDGEKTIGRLLSAVPRWASGKTGASGLATWANMCRFCDVAGDAGNIFRDIGRAYDRWDAEFDFGDCVEVRTDEVRLSAGDSERDDTGYREHWVQVILGTRSVLDVALDVHMTANGGLERGMGPQTEDVRALRHIDATWKNDGICDFDDAVRAVIKAALVEAEQHRDKHVESLLKSDKWTASDTTALPASDSKKGGE